MPLSYRCRVTVDIEVFEALLTAFELGVGEALPVRQGVHDEGHHREIHRPGPTSGIPKRRCRS